MTISQWEEAPQQILGSRGHIGSGVQGEEGTQGAAAASGETATASVRLVQLERELDRALRASAAGQILSEFTHQLNQPLASIIAYADASAELVRSGKMPESQILAILQSISAEAERAGKIIRDARVRFSTPRQQPAPLDLNQAIRDVSSLVAGTAQALGARLSLDLSPRLPIVQADPLRIRQALLILLQDALDAPAGGDGVPRTIQIVTGLHGDAGIEARLCDNRPEAQTDLGVRAFESYSTGRATGPAQDLPGMDLAIARSLIAAHGGKIGWSRAEDGGTIVHFTLPAGQPGEES
jgi:two-component system, LuxR family, sensor kinase FixL